MQNNRMVSLAYATAIGVAWVSGNITHNIDRFIALNRFSADKLSNGGIPGDKISICGNFIESSLDAVTMKNRYVLYIGRLSSEKGLHTLFEAWRGVEGIVLKLAGTGPLEGDLRAMAGTHALKNIEFLGFMSGSEKETLIREALCTVMPSEWYENFPLAILESYALATPVIASRIGGLPEMVEHETTGLLFTPGDSSDLNRCITRIAGDPVGLQRMATNALDAARERFGPDNHYRHLMKIYRAVMKNKQEVIA